MTSTYWALAEIVHRVSGADVQRLPLQTNIVTAFALERSSVEMIAAQVEQRFGIRLPMTDWLTQAPCERSAPPCFRVEQLIALIEQSVAARGSLSAAPPSAEAAGVL